VDSDRFNLDEVIVWLDGRTVPADGRAPDEAAGPTYGGRVRRRLRPAERSDDSTFRSLLALAPQVCGDASHSDYLYLLLCLAFLRQHDLDRWTQLARSVPPSGDPSDARRLLRRVVAAVDGSLGYPYLLGGPDAPPTRLRPLAFEPMHRVMELAAGLGLNDFLRLRAAVVREVCERGTDEFYTPAYVTRTMVALLGDRNVRGDVTVYDPYTRFGELAAEFVRAATDQAAVRVGIEHPRRAELRLAGMWLATTGTRAELALTSSPPPDGADIVLANPPFGQHSELEWVRHCVASLAEDGRAAILMPYGAGFDAGARARAVRRELVEQGAVSAVVALPAQMFQGTSIGVCVWLLRHPTGVAAPIRLVDARKLGRPPSAPPQTRHVLDAADTTTIAAMVAESENQPGFSVLAPLDEIRAHQYSLHPPEYQDRTLAPTAAHAARLELDALFENLSSPSYTTSGAAGWPRRPLRETCDIRAGVPHGSLRPAISRADTAREAAPVVHPRHLRDGLIRPDDAPNADLAALKDYQLRTGDVLLVRTGAMGQTAIVRRGESGWLPHTNLLRLRVTETNELNHDYLLAYLSQPAVQVLIQERSVRSVTTSLSTATLGDFEIPLPPLATQQRILSALQALDEQAAAIERRLNAVRAARNAFARHVTEGTVILTEGGTSE
jgi:type I restriction enzyme M protein